MKRILFALTILLASAIWSNANAGKIIQPPGGTLGQPIRYVLQWVIGNQRVSTFTTDSCVNGKQVFTAWSVWLNHRTNEITVTQDRSIVKGDC